MQNKIIEYNDQAKQEIQNYIRKYSFYYQELYEDSGIWSQEMILEGYRKEAVQRYNEILTVIENTLMKNIIVYLENYAIIKWKSKIIRVEFSDIGDKRIIQSVHIN